MGYLEHIVAIALIYAILASSLDLVIGHAGMFSVAQAAFWGIGGYATALITIRGGTSPAVAAAAGVGAAAILAVVISIPTLRLSDEYFLIATFAYQVIVTGLMTNWTTLTRGPLGINSIPPPFAAMPHQFTAVVVLAAAATLALTWRLVNSPYGRVLHALREDEILCRALGKPVVKLKVTVFTLSASIAAVAGALLAWYVTYIDPTNFTVTESILIVSMVIIGGAGTTFGPFFGAVLLIVLPELMRFVGLPAAATANLRQILYGAAMVAMLALRPYGLLGRQRPAQ